MYNVQTNGDKDFDQFKPVNSLNETDKKEQEKKMSLAECKEALDEQNPWSTC